MTHSSIDTSPILMHPHAIHLYKTGCCSSSFPKLSVHGIQDPPGHPQCRFRSRYSIQMKGRDPKCGQRHRQIMSPASLLLYHDGVTPTCGTLARLRQLELTGCKLLMSPVELLSRALAIRRGMATEQSARKAYGTAWPTALLCDSLASSLQPSALRHVLRPWCQNADLIQLADGGHVEVRTFPQLMFLVLRAL